MKRSRMRAVLGFGILLALALFLAAASLASGSVTLSPGQIVSALFAPQDTFTLDIVRNMRLPRLLSAGLLGGALSVSGFLLQTFFANPIAGPFVLGISSGAKLSVALVMIVCLERGVALGSAGLIGAAFVGSMLVMGLILLLSGRVRRMSLLVICGVMVGYICSAITDLAVTFASDANIVNLHHWSMGSFSGIGWEAVRTIAPVTAAGVLCAFLLSKPMGAYQMGEGYAESVGVPIRRFRVALILLSSLLSACVTAFAGPISFVGIAVPHLMKRALNTSKPLAVIPAVFLGGAVFCMLC
ncbi:MAG: iron ABC transporter permease, partial [Oscillospiraceae bacterium]|nr:iron ABC transporter permease [Oscillospiraceae bacterium]